MLPLNKNLFSNFIIFYIIFVVDVQNISDVNAKNNQIQNITGEYSMQIFNEDHLLTLICYGSKQLNWSSRKSDENQEDNSTPVIEENTNTFPVKLIILKVSYLNTGNYSCEKKDEDKRNKVYVYVNENNNAFSPSKNITENDSNQNITIPCRASSPKVKFELKENSLQDLNSLFYNFKHKATVDLNETSAEEKYHCIGLKKFNRTNEFEIIIQYKKETPKNIERPILKEESEKHIVGHQLKLSCMMKLDQNKMATWWWNLPVELKKNDSRLNLDLSKNNITTLTLTHLSIFDSGNYTCNFKTDSQNTSQTITVNVKDRPSSVSLIGPTYICPNENSLFICKAVGYPSPNISWAFKKYLRNETCMLEKNLNRHNVKHKFVTYSTFIVSSTGTLFCDASNTEGKKSNATEVIVSDIPGCLAFNVWIEEIYGIIKYKSEFVYVIAGDPVVIHCGSAKYNSSGSLQWYFRHRETPLTSNNVYDIHNKSTEYSYQSIIKISNITKNEAGRYDCHDGYQSVSKYLSVVNQVSPVINDTNLESKEIIMLAGSNLKFYCKTLGKPDPEIIWKKNGKGWLEDKKRIKINTNCSDQQYRCSTITISNAIKEDEGNYSCEALNRFGYKAVKTSFILIKDDKTVSTWFTIVSIFSVIILIIAVTFLYIKLRNKNRRIAEFENAGLHYFDKGDVECINPNLPIDDQADLLPYYNKWEFPREKLKLGKVLGAGAFGIVMKGEAKGIVNGESSTTVGVKMVKNNADIIYVKALASELKIMVHLGLNLNVVNLLGACTKNLSNIRELCIIVEYCRYGNLLNYLQRHRRHFINQIDPLTGTINAAIVQDSLTSCGSANANWSESEISNNNNCNTEVNILTTSTGEDALTILSNHGTQQPEWRFNYQGDLGNVATISSKDLLCWSFQIARGMDYLLSRNILHGDLAARNVLLADNYVVKISDFGLARSMYKDGNYVKSNNSPLPIKWMALESIRDRIFSVRSDVWSYGIVLWEIFSLGQTPYPEMNVDEIFFQKLQDGYRLPKPEFATKELHQIMLQCWEARPKNRPLFDRLAEDVGMMLENAVREHYINLNTPYVIKNKMQSKERSDYLAMMSSPDFDNSASTSYYINELPTSSNTDITSDSNTSYLCMKPKTALINLDSANKNDKLSNDSTIAEMLPILSLCNSSDTRSDIESDSDVTYNTRM